MPQASWSVNKEGFPYGTHTLRSGHPQHGAHLPPAGCFPLVRRNLRHSLHPHLCPVRPGYPPGCPLLCPEHPGDAGQAGLHPEPQLLRIRCQRPGRDAGRRRSGPSEPACRLGRAAGTAGAGAARCDPFRRGGSRLRRAAPGRLRQPAPPHGRLHRL